MRATRCKALASLVVLSVGFGVSACGGSGSGSGVSASTPPPAAAPAPAASTTAGLWKGTVTSDVTGQTLGVVGVVDGSGHSLWMRTDGAVWDGPMPHELGNFELHMNSHLYEGSEFPDGTHHGLAVMHIESHTNSYMDGRFAGSGDAGRFALTRSAMWDRPASLDSAAGTYTRSDSSGYAMSMTISANGQLSGSDSRGCQFTGTVHVPDPEHNLYRMETDVSSCGTFDGHYEGMGTLVDADAMQDWMSRMRPFQHGHHAGGGHMGGQVTVPGGQRNLFMFVLANESNAMMDALAK